MIGRAEHPERSRLVQRASERVERLSGREEITSYLSERIEAGLVRDRASIVEALQDAGLEITRAGKDYITAKNPETDERWRLKGEIYNEGWTVEQQLDRAATVEGRGG